MRFLPDCGVADEEQAEVEWILDGLAVGDVPGSLPPPVHRIEVVRRITGGRSGSQVLELRIRRGVPWTVEWHVVKLQDAEAAWLEWQAYRTHMADLKTAYLTSITAVSAALTGADRPPQGERMAVVYQHVSERIGEPGIPTVTLEDLARQALGGSPDAIRSAETVVDRLVRRLRRTLSRDARRDPDRTVLRSLNTRLGPDLVVELADEDEFAGPARRIYPADLFSASCSAGTGEEDPRFAVGEWVVVPMESVHLKDGTVIACPSADTRIEVRPAREARRRLLSPADTDGRVRAGSSLRAQVVDTRILRFRRLVREVLGDEVLFVDAGLRLDDVLVGPPFGRLRSILCDSAEGWVSATVHDDLNPRNVLVAEDQPYLIDHARADDDMPLLGDPAWLEVNLVRDVVARRLSPRELVRLSRCLAVASRLGRPGRDAGDGAWSLRWPCQGQSEAFGAAFRVLWRIRAAARDGYPPEGRQPWWREYLSQLTLAACRTLKWPRDAHDRGTVHAALAAAGVAGEFLASEGEGGPAAFDYWSTDELHLVALELLPVLDPGSPDGLTLLLDVVSAVDARGAGSDDLAAVVEQARDRTVRALCSAAAEQRLRVLSRRRTPFIPLRGSVVDRGEAAPAGNPGTDHEGPALRLIGEHAAVVLVGGAGAGKSTVLRELEYLYACAVLGDRTDPPVPPRLPVLMHAADIARVLGSHGGHSGYSGVMARASTAGELLGGPLCGRLLRLRGVRLMVDGLDELPLRDQEAVERWLRDLREHHPDVPLVLCRRTSAYRTTSPDEHMRLPVVRLHGVTRDQARRYAAGHTADGQGPPWHELLFDTGSLAVNDGAVASVPGRTSAGMHELLHTPLFLWMAVEAHNTMEQPPRSTGELFDVFTKWYLTERHHSSADRARPEAEVETGIGTGVGTQAEPAERLAFLEDLAEYLIDHGPTPLGRLTSELVDRRPPGCRDLLNAIMASGLVEEVHGLAKFRHELFQAYCGGRVLARLAEGDAADRADLLRRILRNEWQEPAHMLVGLPRTTPETLDRVLGTAADADARYAAWLMRAAPGVARDTVEGFVARQRRVLVAETSGPDERHRAASALVVLRDERVWTVLADAVADPAAPGGVLVACLTAVTAAVRHDRTVLDQAGPGTPATTLARMAGDTLARTVPLEAEIAALRAVRQGRLVSLAAFAAERVRHDRPWLVVRDAVAALAALGVALTPTSRAVYEEVCRRRLAAADDEARTASRTSDSAALARERIELLSVVAQSTNRDALEILLEHRFDPALAYHPHWSRLLSAAAHTRRATSPGDALAHLLLAEPGGGSVPGATRQHHLRVFAEGTDAEATAAAHRLLSDSETPPRELPALVGPSSSDKRLLAAAAAVECLLPSELAAVETLVTELIAPTHLASADRLNVLAALVGAVGRQSHLLRVRLVHAASRALERHGTDQALCGPWAQAYYSAEIDHDVLTQLLEHGEDGSTRLAMDHMSSMDFLLTAGSRPDPLAVSADAERRILASVPAGWDAGSSRPAAEPASAAEVFRHVQAVSYAGLTQAAEFVAAVGGSDEAARTLVRYAHSDHGVLDVALAAHAVTAVGWFGRLAGEQGDPDAVRKARAWLRRRETRGSHPSLARARLVGLALLGEWRPLLLALGPGDAVLREAAAQSVRYWLPAPWQTGPPGELRTVADWVAGRLASGEVTDNEARETLAGILGELSRRLERLVGAPPPPADRAGRSS
ncbi:hypothetical protein OG216_38430 [Streptomycetaceae bacterium NBC_01309]